MYMKHAFRIVFFKTIFIVQLPDSILLNSQRHDNDIQSECNDLDQVPSGYFNSLKIKCW